MVRWLPLLLLAFSLSVGSGARAATAPLYVVATTPDLGDLASRVGGDQVEVEVLVKGPQDPHRLEPRPSMIRTLHRADLFVLVGMDLEVGWAPALLQSARNPALLPGGRGHLDASTGLRPLEVPQGPVDRSMGDLHVYGNPHYLSDPREGLRVAALLRDRLSELAPAHAAGFSERYDAFAVELEARLADWLALAPANGTLRAVEDHSFWAYFAARFGLELVTALEPRPGITPSTRHLASVVERMKAEAVPLVLATPYHDEQRARWVAERAGARVALMAHQVGAREGTDDYMSMVEHNVGQVFGPP